MFLNISVIQCVHFKKQLMVVDEIGESLANLIREDYHLETGRPLKNLGGFY